MMEFLTKCRRLSIYWKMLILCVSLITVALLFISILLYSLFSGSANREIENMSLATLEQISYTAEIVDQQVTELTSQLVVNADVMAAMQAGENDPVLNYHALMVMNNLANSYHYVNDIALYNGNTGQYVSSLATDTEIDRELFARIQESGPGVYSQIYPRVLRQQLLTGPVLFP